MGTKAKVSLGLVVIFTLLTALVVSSYCHQPYEEGTFACAINCMDGRIQDAVQLYMQQKYRVEFVDMVTQPGPSKILSEKTDSYLVDNIKRCVGISIHRHGAKIIALAGHHTIVDRKGKKSGCSGNPLPKEQQIHHLRAGRKTVEDFDMGVKVVLLWVDENCKAEEVQ